jgi:hypothetical protein
MKGKKEDRKLRALFRHKLENAEIMPSPGFDKVLMRRLARKEFLSFIPSRFNIWYALGLAAAGAVTAVVLLSGPKRNENILSDPSSGINNRNVIITRTDSLLKGSEEEKDDGLINLVQNQPENPSDKSSPVADVDGSGQAHFNERQVSPVSPVHSGSPGNGSFLQDPLSGKDSLRGVKQTENVILTSVSEGCTPLKVKFIGKASGYESLTWEFGDGGYSSEKDPEWIFDIEGEYEVILKLFGPEGLLSVSSCIINVYPKPVAGFEIVPLNNALPNEKVAFQNYSAGAVKFKWSFGDGTVSDLFSPEHSYSRPGNYDIGLIAISEHGCSDTLIINNAFSGPKYFIDFPNAFIPNNDGPSNGYYSAKSDESAYVFHPESFGVSDYQLRIFSKHGVLIFESNDLNIGWDGYYKGQLCKPGVYIWKVRGKFINREPFTKMGDLTLLKN